MTVPGKLDVTAKVDGSAANGDVTGFVILTHDGQTRRVPFWVEVDHPVLAHEPARTLTHPGIYEATTVGGSTRRRPLPLPDRRRHASTPGPRSSTSCT